MRNEELPYSILLRVRLAASPNPFGIWRSEIKSKTNLKTHTVLVKAGRERERLLNDNFYFVRIGPFNGTICQMVQQ